MDRGEDKGSFSGNMVGWDIQTNSPTENCLQG